jgi:phage tail tape-measure protein
MGSIDRANLLLIAMVALTVTGAAAAIAGLLTASAAMIASMKRPRPPRPAGRHCGRPPGPTGPPPDALLRKTPVEVPTRPLELP